VKYRSKWKQTDSGFLEITISFLNSVIDAHEYLIDQFVSSTLPFYLKEDTRDIPPDVGDVSFYKGRIFIRNNIVVKIHAEGEMKSLVKDIVKEIDTLLLAQETVESYDMVKPRIIITSDNKKEIVKP